MATKTFEELKQMAIQIRDEKTNKQNTATRIGTQMLEHLNKLEQDFLDKDTTEGKFSELDSLLLNQTFNNVDGSIAAFKGRFQINRLFAIDASPNITFSPSLTAYYRYYDINKKYISSIYTSEAKFVAVGGVVNDERIVITKNDIAKYILSVNEVRYQCVDGLPLVNDDIKSINASIKSNFVQSHKYFINRADGDITVEFSNINGEYCDVIVKFIGGAILMNIQKNKFLANPQDVSFEHAPYKYGIVYAKVANETDQFNSFEIGRLGIYGTDVNVLTPEKGYYYVPIIAWYDGKIIYRIENYSEYNELKQKAANSVTKDEMNNFAYTKNFILGKYVGGGAIGSPVFFVSDPKRAYLDKIIKGNAGDSITLKTNVGDSGITGVSIRCIDDNGNYTGTPNTVANNTFELPENTTGFYITILSSKELTPENTSNAQVVINNVVYPLYGKGGYQNPSDEIKEYVDEKLENLNITANDYYNYLVACFERIVCIGDSITAGFTGSEFAGQTVGSNDARVTARNWPSYFKRTTGTDVINLGYGSTATKHWRASTPETASANLYCALDLANIEGTQAYFIMLGWNDTITAGTTADIQDDYNDNAETFYGNYDNIVRRLHEMKPKAHIFVFTLARGKKNSAYNEAIKYVASLYPTYCHCIDYSNDPFFDTAFFNASADGTHYSPLSYNAFGNFVRNIVSKYIYDNPTKFNGIPYTADNNLKGNIDVQGLRLSSINLSISEIGKYETLFAEILPNTSANKKVNWKVISGDSECINLIPNQSSIYCTIKGVKQGFALVQASSEEGGYKATCMVSVAQDIVNVTNIELNSSTLQIPLSEGEKTITATITPSGATNKNVRWSLQSGGDSVATIEATGLTCIITPRGEGTDTIIAVTEDGNREARCNINVTA